LLNDHNNSHKINLSFILGGSSDDNSADRGNEKPKEEGNLYVF
jgi:hypothetical protein